MPVHEVMGLPISIVILNLFILNIYFSPDIMYCSVQSTNPALIIKDASTLSQVFNALPAHLDIPGHLRMRWRSTTLTEHSSYSTSSTMRFHIKHAPI